jgi:hypothetical protein
MGVICSSVGLIFGLLYSRFFELKHQQQVQKQEKKGGFAIWIKTNTDSQVSAANNILFKNNAKSIEVTTVTED